MPRADPPGRGIGRQVNVRLAHSDRESLQVAAKLLGAKPTTIARMLILNGVRRVLAEHDAAIAAARTAVR